MRTYAFAKAGVPEKEVVVEAASDYDARQEASQLLGCEPWMLSPVPVPIPEEMRGVSLMEYLEVHFGIDPEGAQPSSDNLNDYHPEEDEEDSQALWLLPR